MKIFLSVGGQIPFDRLVKKVDAWISADTSYEAFAQIGPGGYQPRHMDWAEFLNPDEYREKVRNADVIVSHAGMGSIITALQYQTPIVILPRRAALEETRNDHQVGTVHRFADREGIYAAFEEFEVPNLIESIKSSAITESISSFASKELIEKLREFING